MGVENERTCARRDGQACLVRPVLRREGGQGKIPIPVQLITSSTNLPTGYFHWQYIGNISKHQPLLSPLCMVNASSAQ